MRLVNKFPAESARKSWRNPARQLAQHPPRTAHPALLMRNDNAAASPDGYRAADPFWDKADASSAGPGFASCVPPHAGAPGGYKRSNR